MGLSIFMAFSVDGVVMTLSGVCSIEEHNYCLQMVRFIYGMALYRVFSVY